MSIIIRPARPEEANWLTEIACRAKARWGYIGEQIADWKPAFLTIASDYVRQHSLWVAEYVTGQPVAFAALELRRSDCESLGLDCARRRAPHIM